MWIGCREIRFVGFILQLAYRSRGHGNACMYIQNIYLKCENNEGGEKKCRGTAQSSFEPMVMTKSMLTDEMLLYSNNVILSD